MANSKITDYSYQNEPNNENLDTIPGDNGLPVLGHTIPFFTDPFEFAKEQYKKFGPVSKIRSLNGDAVLVLGPDCMQEVNLDPGKNFSSRMGFIDRVGQFFSGSLIMEDFEQHKHQRRIVQTAFKSDAMRFYTEEINRIYDRALDEWDGDVGKTIPFFMYIKEVLLEVAAEIFIGEKERGERVNKLNKAFIDCVNGTMYILPWMIPGFTYYKGKKGQAFLREFFGELVTKKRAGNDKDMLSHFCREKDENGEYFSDEEIANQATFLLFAAHDTTTAAIAHTIYYLAKNPEVKEKVYQEILALGKPDLSYDDLDKVPYMSQVFFEVQRKRTSTPIIPRRTVRDVELAGVKIPAHTMVYSVPRFTHHMEEYWSEPEKFDPDRFSDERAEHKQHPFIFHPFGGGAHKCIGMHFSQMEYKCFLYKFLLKYDFVSKHKKAVPKMQTLPLPKPGDDMPIELIRRA